MIDHLPKMIAVQAEGCAPLVKAYDEGKKATEKWENGDTIAFAIFDPVTFEGCLLYTSRANRPFPS